MLPGLRIGEVEESVLFEYVAGQMLPSVRLAMSLFRMRNPSHEGEMKIVVHAMLLKKEESDARFHVRIQMPFNMPISFLIWAFSFSQSTLLSKSSTSRLHRSGLLSFRLERRDQDRMPLLSQ